VLLFALLFTWGLGNRTFLSLGSKGETNTFSNEKCCTDGWTFAISTLCEQLLANLITCCDHCTLLLNLVALADIDGFWMDSGFWLCPGPRALLNTKN